MAGVRINARDLGGVLRQDAAMLRGLVKDVERQIPGIARERLNMAADVIRGRSPVKTGRFAGVRGHLGWHVERRGLLEFAVSTDPVDKYGRHYGSFVHRKGERGWPFWERHALPVVEDAEAQIGEQVQALIRQTVQSAGGRRVNASITPSRSLRAIGRFGL